MEQRTVRRFEKAVFFSSWLSSTVASSQLLVLGWSIDGVSPNVERRFNTIWVQKLNASIIKDCV